MGDFRLMVEHAELVAGSQLDEFRWGAPKTADDEDIVVFNTRKQAEMFADQLKDKGVPNVRVEKTGAGTQLGMAGSMLKMGHVINPFGGGWGVIVPRAFMRGLISQGKSFEMTESTDSWSHAEPRDYVERITAEYGPPDALSEYQARWLDKIPGMTEVIVKDELILHKFPKEHNDFLYSSREIDVPPEVVEELTEVSPSIIVDVLKGIVTVRGAFLKANAITLGFVEDVALGKAEPSHDEYARRLHTQETPEWFSNDLHEGVGGAVVAAAKAGARKLGTKVGASFQDMIQKRLADMGDLTDEEEAQMKRQGLQPGASKEGELLGQTLTDYGMSDGESRRWVKRLNKAYAKSKGKQDETEVKAEWDELTKRLKWATDDKGALTTKGKQFQKDLLIALEDPEGEGEEPVEEGMDKTVSALGLAGMMAVGGGLGADRYKQTHKPAAVQRAVAQASIEKQPAKFVQRKEGPRKVGDHGVEIPAKSKYIRVVVKGDKIYLISEHDTVHEMSAYGVAVQAEGKEKEVHIDFQKAMTGALSELKKELGSFNVKIGKLTRSGKDTGELERNRAMERENQASMREMVAIIQAKHALGEVDSIVKEKYMPERGTDASDELRLVIQALREVANDPEKYPDDLVAQAKKALEKLDSLGHTEDLMVPGNKPKKRLKRKR